MKKIISAVMIAVVLLSSFCMDAFASEVNYPLKTEEIRVRDPYILVYEGKYYMYGTCLSNGKGYGCVVSENLQDWSVPVQVYSPAEDSDEFADFWAPECHYYKGSFYLFATYRSKETNKRGTAIFKAASPLGPFEMITDGHITPKGTDCIDGTLYVDDEGQPWMVYVNEWTSSSDSVGEMSAAKLSEDLTSFEGESKLLFRANKHIWTNGGVTDGPFIYKTKSGRLVMLWSNAARPGGYAVGMAVSDNGRTDGNWIQYPYAFYCREEYGVEGGHPMLFTTLEGELKMAIHSPNGSENGVFETLSLYSVKDKGNIIAIDKKPTVKSVMCEAFFEIYYNLIKIWYKIF